MPRSRSSSGSNHFEFDADLWLWDGQAAWHFISVPEAITDEIDDRFGHSAKGFGSIKVEAQIGSSCFSTSLFPDSKRKTYVLPVKKSVRAVERLAVGTTARVQLTVIV
jgi:hypothetical protein